ncbi:MAG: hypothetical protein HFE86_09460 [Clostridiales bacterium]|nr:hypothetical protein [Clostridiales bacterium]
MKSQTMEKRKMRKTNMNWQWILRFMIACVLTITVVFPKLAVAALEESVDYVDPYAALPSKVDMAPSFPPVGDQGNQGSCTAWAVVYALKTHQEQERHNNWDITVPEHQFSPAYVFNQLTPGGRPIAIDYAMGLIVEQGVCTLKSFPYNPNDYTTQPNDDQRAEAAQYKAGSCRTIEGIDKIKAYLASGDGVVISVYVYPDFQTLSPSNPIYDTKAGKTDNNYPNGHAICLIGYDDSMQAFKFINSHGTDYGIDGYGWISYKFVNDQTVNTIGAGLGYIMTDVPLYTITYSANSGSFAPGKQEGDGGQIISLSTQKPTRFGYNFLGWSTDRTAERPMYKAGSQVRLTENLTLYAVWEEARPLGLDEEIYWRVEPREELYYQFTPASTGLYQFSVSCSDDPFEPKCGWFHTDGGWQSNVSTIKDGSSLIGGAWLEAGKKYYLPISFPSASKTTSFDFTITEAAITDLFIPGTYKIGYFVTDGYCLDAVGYGLENGTEVQLFSYNNQSNQNWDIQRTEDGYYTVSPVYNPAQCLTFVQNAPLLLNARDGSNSQKWIIQTYRDYCKLIPKSDTASIAAPTTLPTPPIEDCVRSTDDYDNPLYRGGFLWRIESVNNPPDTEVELAPGTYRIKNLNSSMYLHGWYNAAGGSAGLYQDVAADGENQTWIVRDAGEGYRYLSPACNPDLYVTFLAYVGRCSLTPRSGADSQKWKVLEGPDGYSRFALKSAPGHVMVVQYASTIRYESIITYGDNGSSNGKWIVTPVAPQRTVAEGVYEIQNVNSGLYFDACNFGTSDGTRILQWSRNDGANQRFRVKYAANGFYTLSPVYAPDMYLAAFADGTVKLTTNGVSDLSLWRILRNPDGSCRFSPKSDLDKAAVVQYASTEVGAELILYDDNGSTNGWWKLNPVLSTTEMPTLQDTMYSIQNQRSGLSVCYDLADADKTLNQGRGDFAYWGSLAGDGYYTFQQYKYGNYISVDRDGRTVITDCLSDEDTRLWKVMDDGRIYSKKYPNKVLAVENDSMERGARLILADAGTANSEQWSFVLA